MAKLYPPSLAGTLPSFYKSNTGTVTITVPFSMNQSVSRAAVNGFALRIKRTTTDTLIGVVYSTSWNIETSSVTFDSSNGLDDCINKMVPGDFYKLQLAYYQTVSGTKQVGYYSNAAIAKYTKYPSVVMPMLEQQQINTVNTMSFYGQYDNADVSEKVYEYRFLINSQWKDEITGTSRSGVFLDTGWLVHDSTTDTELSSSSDYLQLPKSLNTAVNYTFQYQVITNNGLTISSPTYSVVQAENVGEELGILVHTELDYDNGRIILTFSGQSHFNGTYMIQRSEGASGYTEWITLDTFTSDAALTPFIYYDYSIESGTAYKYGLQKISANNILSQRAVSINPIGAYFEDCFLYDGERQLRIRYNSNIQSFKEIIAETKKTTLGSKYPLIFRNGTLCYKEFPITGLLSYLTDPDELFMTKEELLSTEVRQVRGRKRRDKIAEKNPITSSNLTMHSQFEETTEQTDENVAAEKNFAMFALSWLNNGKIKLFKSSQEGNFIVKCTNVSLAPFNGTNRMIHSFTCTADEIQEYSANALSEYNLLTGLVEDSSEIEPDYREITINIAAIREDIYDTFANSDDEDIRRQNTVNALAVYDFTQGYNVKKITITGGNHGQLFSWGDMTFGLDANGSYEIERDTAVAVPLYLATYTSSKLELLNSFGRITLKIRIASNAIVENKDSQRVLTYFGWGGYGHELLLDEYGQSRNLLQDFADNKFIVSKSYQTIIHSYPIFEEANIAGRWNASDYTQTKLKNTLLYDKYILYKDGNSYYRYNGSDLVSVVPDTQIRTKKATNALIDIQDYGSAGQEIIGINYLNPDEVYWTIGNNVCATFYLQVQQITYAIENEPALIATKEAAEAARIEWYKLAFNLIEISIKPESESTLLFIWSTDHFTQITLDNWLSYSVNTTIYTTYNGVYSTSAIQNAYIDYRTKEKRLEDYIQERLT